MCRHKHPHAYIRGLLEFQYHRCLSTPQVIVLNQSRSNSIFVIWCIVNKRFCSKPALSADFCFLLTACSLVILLLKIWKHRNTFILYLREFKCVISSTYLGDNLMIMKFKKIFSLCTACAFNCSSNQLFLW